MTLITLDDAEREFTESVAYYESREIGLGSRFRDEVAAVADWILRFPEVPRLRPRGYRRVNLRAFPHYTVNRRERKAVLVCVGARVGRAVHAKLLEQRMSASDGE